MAQIKKLGLPSKERKALLRGLATSLLMNGKLNTTLANAKSVRPYAEKIITLAINSYEDTVKTTKTVMDKNNKKTEKEVIVDGPTKLAARRKMMTLLYDVAEERKDKETKAQYVARTKDINHPLIEKIFNVYAPKYATRAKELGTKGGYSRILKLGKRLGDNAEVAIIELV